MCNRKTPYIKARMLVEKVHRKYLKRVGKLFRRDELSYAPVFRISPKKDKAIGKANENCKIGRFSSFISIKQYERMPTYTIISA